MLFVQDRFASPTWTHVDELGAELQQVGNHWGSVVRAAVSPGLRLSSAVSRFALCWPEMFAVRVEWSQPKTSNHSYHSWAGGGGKGPSTGIKATPREGVRTLRPCESDDSLVQLCLCDSIFVQPLETARPRLSDCCCYPFLCMRGCRSSKRSSRLELRRNLPAQAETAAYRDQCIRTSLFIVFISLCAML